METTIAKNNLKAAVTTDKKQNKTIFDLIEMSKSQFEKALPKHLTSEKFTRVAITEIRKNPSLLKCNSTSLLGSLMTAAQLGLEIGVLGQAYLIPYGSECQFQIGYKGMIELLRRSGQLKDIYAYAVYENDEFSIEYGLSRGLIHKPTFKDRGAVVGYYAVAILKDDTKSFFYMTKDEVTTHAKRFSKAFNFKSSPWQTDFDEMAMKTCIKKMVKYLPVSTEFLESITKDEKTYSINEKKEIKEVDNDELDIIEIAPAESDNITVDEDGVIVEEVKKTDDGIADLFTK